MMIEIPRRLRQRPKTPTGRPIPYTVPVDRDGRPDFRVSEPERWIACVTLMLCPLCGQHLDGLWFVGGPLCAQNGVFHDPPMHRDCAEYALQVCPFHSDLEARPAMEGYAELPMASPVKPDRFMLGRARLYGVKGPLLHASKPWLELHWWRNGAPMGDA